MHYYHLLIKKNNEQWVFSFDLSKEVLEKKMLHAFMKHESFMVRSTVVRYSEIDQISIFQTEISSKDILKKTQRKRTLKKLVVGSNESWSVINAKEVFSMGKDVTEELLKDLNDVSSPVLEKVVDGTRANVEKNVYPVQMERKIGIDEQTEHARSLLYELENTLRQFVGSKIEENNGEIDKEFVRSWESAKRKEFLPPRKPLESQLINYSSFEHLRRIITHNNNWDKLFRTYFGRPNGVISRINEIDEIRDTIAHNRILSDFDYKSFITLYNELMGCIEPESFEPSIQIVKLEPPVFPLEPEKAAKSSKGLALLKDTTDITSLFISNKLLDTIHKKAFNDVKKLFPDAELSIFSVFVFPFMINKVHVSLTFYSKETDRIPTYSFTDIEPIVRHDEPDKFRNRKMSPFAFATLPWVKSPKWLGVLKRTYRNFSPLSKSMGSNYNVNAYATSKGVFWVFQFEDGLSGKEYVYSWSGNSGDDVVHVE